MSRLKSSKNQNLISSLELIAALMTFANSLDPDQDRHNVGPDLDLIRLTL